jgi:HEAT repeat protein
VRAEEAGEKFDAEAAVTALQVARAAGDTSVLRKARELAAKKDVLVRLRMSAIGTLGDIGSQEDIALLEELCSDPEKRVKRVARHNLGKLKGKYAQ